VRELRLRQRNIVFPYTVRNWGVFYRNLTSKSAYAYISHRVFAFFLSLCLLITGIYFVLLNMIFVTTGGVSLRHWSWLGDLSWSVEWLLWMAVVLKVAVHALVREDQPKRRPPKTYPHVKI
jgi:hypothetical protein